MIPADLTTPIIAASSVAATWLVAILTRKGAKEDTRIKEDDQAFVQMQALADRYEKEANRLQARVDVLEGERQGARDSELTRFDAQAIRCRAASAALVDTIAELRANCASPTAIRHAEEALQALEDHRARDHPSA